MVIEILNSWEQLFQAIDLVRGDRIDAVRFRYRSDQTGRMESRRWPVRTVSDLQQIQEAFPAIYRKFGFTEFKIEVGDDEIVEETVGGRKGVVLRVLLVTAS